MTNIKLAVLGFIVFIILVGGGYYIYQRQITQKGTDILPLPKPGAGFGFSPKPSTSTSPTPNFRNFPSSLNSQPQTGENEIKNIGISLNMPAQGAKIAKGTTVAGFANVFEGRVNIRVKDANGKVLGTTYSIACMGQDSCPFETTIDFQTPQTPTGTVEAYSTSPKNGQEQYLQTVAVTF